MRADGTITAPRAQQSGRTTLLIAILLGPVAMALLVWKADPLWCQQLLSIYFAFTAALCLLNEIDDRHAVVRHFHASNRVRGADALMVMAICYLLPGAAE